MPMIVSPFVHPIYVMLKPAGARCNLACRYCYYLEKSALYGQAQRHAMTDELLEEFIKQYISMQSQREVLFTWHGGETMLRPLSFYRLAVSLQRKYADGHVIDNCIQTNGTLLDHEWCRFLHDNRWLVGLSIDGPQPLHDAFRKARQGKGTFYRVCKAVELLEQYGVEWNGMAVVNRLNAEYPHEFYRFFKEIGCRYIQFTPIVEPAAPALTPPSIYNGNGHVKKTEDNLETMVTRESVLPEQWGRFLCSVFDEWVCQDVGRVYVQLFDATLANWVGVEPGVCSMAEKCGYALAMEFNGDVYACDHFVYPQYRLGNIWEHPLNLLAYGEKQQAFRKLKADALPNRCRTCAYGFACHGECPKNRLIRTTDGEAGLNYLCEGYRHFFSHVAPYMDFMAHEWLTDGAPANVMEAIDHGRLPNPMG